MIISTYILNNKVPVLLLEVIAAAFEEIDGNLVIFGHRPHN